MSQTARAHRLLSDAMRFDWDAHNAQLDRALAEYAATEAAIEQAHLSMIADVRAHFAAAVASLSPERRAELNGDWE